MKLNLNLALLTSVLLITSHVTNGAGDESYIPLASSPSGTLGASNPDIDAYRRTLESNGVRVGRINTASDRYADAMAAAYIPTDSRDEEALLKANSNSIATYAEEQRKAAEGYERAIAEAIEASKNEIDVEVVIVTGGQR